MKKAIYNLYLWGIGLLIIGCCTLIPNANYLFFGTTIDLNDVIAGKHLIDADLPENEFVTLKIDRSYGNFADSLSVKYGDDEYYLVQLDDDSTIIIEVRASKTADLELLEKITDDTLSKAGKSSSSYTCTGNFMKIKKKKLEKYYDEYVDLLIKEKILEDDTDIRYMMINDGGGRTMGLIVGFGCLIAGAFLMFLAIKVSVEYKKSKMNY